MNELLQKTSYVFERLSHSLENKRSIIFNICKNIPISNKLFPATRKCPLCGWEGYIFQPFGNSVKRRQDARCPRCSSLERHRAVYHIVKNKIDEHSHKTLHVAPEPPLQKWLIDISKEYLSIDLFRSAMAKMDLTSLDLEDASKTLIFCSHVLEHIPEDRKAISEMYRVLEKGGVAIIQVPIWKKKTYEDFSITSKEDRLKHFLQEDHVRLYGLDLAERLESVGFHVELLSVNSISTDIVKRLSLSFTSTNEVFFCKK